MVESVEIFGDIWDFRAGGFLFGRGREVAGQVERIERGFEGIGLFVVVVY